jgi:hypothetical protein
MACKLSRKDQPAIKVPVKLEHRNIPRHHLTVSDGELQYRFAPRPIIWECILASCILLHLSWSLLSS